MTSISPREFAKRLGHLASERERGARKLRSLAEVVPQAHDDAYGQRRAGEPYGGSTGGKSDPTAAEATITQQITRDALIYLEEWIEGELAHEDAVHKSVSAVRRRLLGPRARPEEARDPSGPPMVDSPRELAEARAAQRRRQQRQARGEL